MNTSILRIKLPPPTLGVQIFLRQCSKNKMWGGGVSYHLFFSKNKMWGGGVSYHLFFLKFFPVFRLQTTKILPALRAGLQTTPQKIAGASRRSTSVKISHQTICSSVLEKHIIKKSGVSFLKLCQTIVILNNDIS